MDWKTVCEVFFMLALSGSLALGICCLGFGVYLIWTGLVRLFRTGCNEDRFFILAFAIVTPIIFAVWCYYRFYIWRVL